MLVSVGRWVMTWVGVGLIFFGASGWGAEGGAGKVRGRRPGVILLGSQIVSAPAEWRVALEEVLAEHEVDVEVVLPPGRVRIARVRAAKGLSEEEICAKLRATRAVEFAEPDYLLPLIAIPNDPGYSSQWFHPKINTPGAWDVTQGSSAVIVAVCDTGVESTHPDLAANLLLPGYNSVDGSTNTTPVHWHGTAVAGCVGAVGNNGLGVAGVNWTVKIVPVRVSNLGSGSAYLSDIYRGIIWAADRGAKVVNLSYDAADSATVNSAAQYLRARGGLLFVAAGNSGVDPGYPDYASFVAVGATNTADTKTSWSNYGTYIDIVAPGESIYTTYTSGGYASVAGTSFASPIAAGVAALIYALNPAFTPDQVEHLIFTTCVDLGAPGEDNLYGYGRVNAAAAVAKASEALGNSPPTAVASAVPTGGDLPLTVTFDGSASTDPDGTIVAYLWDFGDGAYDSGVTTVHTYTSAGTYTATLLVRDNLGATATDTVVIIVTDSNAINAPSNLAARVASRVVTLTWRDNSGNEEGFRIERGVKSKKDISWQVIGVVGANVTTFAETLSPGTYYYRVRAFNDTTGRTSAYSNTVQVQVSKK